ncbi:uncharacterized protein EI97DRAFT_463594 [Westerdykella ornata]|uniref:Uncharacterized protein n=1 Tax=Westerdykella ornata TaxID=318751 RepID=A0A6A6JZF2_WESOR|nr:uncharacterized protein EI97DRAFT_463594 [Westerdykella ornata]KAF2281228.1 hypothetical protein EI97DRAFT_463594 [Westerdykella ornata]
METIDGANCYAQVICNDGVKEYNEGKVFWSACYVGGRQFFNDPRIGEFSITFTSGGRERMDGLIDPILQLKNVGDWMSIDAAALAAEYNSYQSCDAGIVDKDCYDGPYFCRNFWDRGVGRKRMWECGVPRVGKALGSPDDPHHLDSNGPTNEKGYAPGQCGIHVTHYQKPDPVKDSYSLEIKLFDNNEVEIGASGRVGPNYSLGSKLPYTVEVRTGAVDADPVRFAYAGFEWDSNSPNCKTGAYDSGDRDMDCVFHCD